MWKRVLLILAAILLVAGGLFAWLAWPEPAQLPVEAVTAPRIAIGPPPIPEESRAAPPLDPTTAALFALPAPAPSHERRSRTPAISRLLSTLSRWTGVSGTK